MTLSPGTWKASTEPGRLGVIEANELLQGIAHHSSSRDEAISQTIKIAASLTGALGVAYFRGSNGHSLQTDSCFMAPSHLSQLKSVQQRMQRIAALSVLEGKPQSAADESADQLLVIAVPLRGRPVCESIAIVVGLDQPQHASARSVFLVSVLIWVAAFVSSLSDPVEASDANKELNEPESFSLPTPLFAALSGPDFRTAAQQVAKSLHDSSPHEIIAIGTVGKVDGNAELVALSGTADFDSRSMVVRAIQDAIDEAVIIARCAENENSPAISAKQSQSVARQVAGEFDVLGRYPLRNVGNEIFGAILVLQVAQGRGSLIPDDVSSGSDSRDTSSRTKVSVIHTLTPDVLQWLGWQLGCQRAALPSRWGAWLRLTQGSLHRREIWIGIAACILFLFIPFPYTVRCGCHVEPEQRRFVCIPYDGRLEEALVDPGDLVTAGQVLARMDDHEINWELATLKADLEKAEKNHDKAMAGYEASETQIAALEVQRLLSQIELQEDRLRNLEVRSPVDGVVMGGDPRKQVGARLTKGTSILEVGPVDKMRIELAVPDAQVSHVQAGSKVSYRLDALAWNKYHGTIDVVHPQSESREGANVFIAEMSVESRQVDGKGPEQSERNDAIRPGMRGRAAIRSAYHPLGWNLFHQAWYRLAGWLPW